MSVGIWTQPQAWGMTARQAAIIAAREYADALDGSVGAELARNGGLDFTVSDWSVAVAALTDDHGPIDGCACVLAGMQCDLNALRNYCKRAGDRAVGVARLVEHKPDGASA